MGQKFTNAKPKDETKKYPPFINLKEGQSFVALYSTQPREWDGALMLDLLDRDSNTRTFRWPKGIPLPPVLTPFKLTKLKDGVKGKSRGIYDLEVFIEEAEKNEAWKSALAIFPPPVLPDKK